MDTSTSSFGDLTMINLFSILLLVYGLILSIGFLLIAIERTSNVVFAFLLFPPFLYFLFEILAILPHIKQVVSKPHTRQLRAVAGFYSAIIVTCVGIVNVLSIRTWYQVVFTLLLIPLYLHFFRIIRAVWNRVVEARRRALTTEVTHVTSDSSDVVAQEDRRAFVKLVLGAGVGVVAATLLNPKKASAAFFGSVPGPGVVGVKDSAGVAIDPATHSPTDGYGITHIDNSTYPAYYGFVDKTGAWYVMQENPQNSFSYSKGVATFSTNWTGRSGLTYASFDVTFG